MNGFIVFLGNNMNWIIISFGVLVLILLVANFFALLGQRNMVEEALDRKNRRTVYNRNTGEVEDTDVKEAVTPDTIREYEKKFNSVVLKYNSLSQLIPIFPLLGILGTVSGLIAQLEGNDMEQLFASLNIALGSTYYGIIAAIVLKIWVAFANTRIIEETDIILEDYDKKVDNSVKLGNISQE